jgi:hypothetical protein
MLLIAGASSAGFFFNTMPIQFKMTAAACQKAAAAIEKYCADNGLVGFIWLKRLPALTGFRYDILHHHMADGRIRRANPGQYPIAVDINHLLRFLKNHDAETLLRNKSKLIKSISKRETEIKGCEIAIKDLESKLSSAKLPDWQRIQYKHALSHMRHLRHSRRRRLRRALARSMQVR